MASKYSHLRKTHCERCKSRFDLTFHHTRDKKKFPNVGTTLCNTCHSQVWSDFIKSKHCYYKNKMKLYNKRMDKEGL